MGRLGTGGAARPPRANPDAPPRIGGPIYVSVACRCNKYSSLIFTTLKLPLVVTRLKPANELFKLLKQTGGGRHSLCSSAAPLESQTRRKNLTHKARPTHPEARLPTLPLRDVA